MSVKLVVSDIDGTIVLADKSVAPSTVEAAGRLLAAGVKLALVSARPPRGMQYVVDALKLTGPIAGFNGGAVVAPDGAMLEWHPVPGEHVRAAIDLFTRRGVSIFLFTQTEWLITDPAGPHVEHERRTVRFQERVVPDFTPYLDQVGKLVGVSNDAPLLEAVELELQALVGPGASAKRSQTYYLDLTHAHANKGEAVQALARIAGVDVADVAVLGDMGNDVPMFRVAGYSVAMGNGPADVQAQATATTGRNDEDGWAHAIDTLILPRVRYAPVAG